MSKAKEDKVLVALRAEADKAFQIYYGCLWNKPPVSREVCELARKDFESKLEKYYQYKQEK
jgi:hypothetical protein